MVGSASRSARGRSTRPKSIQQVANRVLENVAGPKSVHQITSQVLENLAATSSAESLAFRRLVFRDARALLRADDELPEHGVEHVQRIEAAMQKSVGNALKQKRVVRIFKQCVDEAPDPGAVLPHASETITRTNDLEAEDASRQEPVLVNMRRVSLALEKLAIPAQAVSPRTAEILESIRAQKETLDRLRDMCTSHLNGYDELSGMFEFQSNELRRLILGLQRDMTELSTQLPSISAASSNTCRALRDAPAHCLYTLGLLTDGLRSLDRVSQQDPTEEAAAMNIDCGRAWAQESNNGFNDKPDRTDANYNGSTSNEINLTTIPSLDGVLQNRISERNATEWEGHTPHRDTGPNFDQSESSSHLTVQGGDSANSTGTACFSEGDRDSNSSRKISITSLPCMVEADSETTDQSVHPPTSTGGLKEDANSSPENSVSSGLSFEMIAGSRRESHDLDESRVNEEIFGQGHSLPATPSIEVPPDMVYLASGRHVLSQSVAGDYLRLRRARLAERAQRPSSVEAGRVAHWQSSKLQRLPPLSSPPPHVRSVSKSCRQSLLTSKQHVLPPDLPTLLGRRKPSR